MSFRSSFCTQFFYCRECFDGLKNFFDKKFFDYYSVEKFPIISGFIGDNFYGQNKFNLDFELREEIEDIICHDFILVIIQEDGEVNKIEYKASGKLCAPQGIHDSV